MTVSLAPVEDPAPSGSLDRAPRRRNVKGALESWGFVAPTWLFMLAVGLIPIGYAVWVSFTDLSLSSDGSRFVGFQN